jgi:membrane protein
MDSKAERERAWDSARNHRGVLSAQPEDLLHGTGWRALWAVIREANLRLWNDDAIPIAGNIAFRSVMALFPFLIFVSSLTAYIGDREMAESLTQFLISIVPAPLVDTLVAELKNVLTVRRGDIASIGVLLTIWFAIGGVDSVRVALNRAYDVREHRSTAVLYLLQILTVIGGALVFVVIAFLLVLLPIIGAYAHRLVPGFEPSMITHQLVRYPAAALILAASLFVAHMVLPARWMRLANIWPGVLLTVVIWLLLAGAFSVYLTYFANYASYYAGLAGVIAALFFIYLSALVLIFGGEINRALRMRRLARSLEIGRGKPVHAAPDA